MGGPGGGGIKTRSVFPDAVPRWRFAYFADAGKVGRPAGRNYPPSPSTDKIPTYPFRSLTKRADNIRPYEGSQPCYGGRPQAAPTLSQIINQFKGSATKRAGYILWQKGYHDHIIRSEADYLRIWDYIDTNPAKWREDCYYCQAERATLP